MSTKTDDKTMQTVSVIMPAHNAAAYIEPAIRSVMAQTYPHWELLVIDDGSTDDTIQIVQRLSEEEPRIQLFCNPVNIGVANTRNRGLEMGSGEYVAFIDSDDVWHPEKLARQLQKLTQENASLVYCSYFIMDNNNPSNKKAYVVPEHTDFKAMLKENVIGCSTVILSRDVAQKYRFTTEFYHEDYCLWLDILRDGNKAVGCSEALVDWRWIVDSRSFNKRRGAQSRWNIYRKYLKLPVWRSAGLFFIYAVSGIRKYGRWLKGVRK